MRVRYSTTSWREVTRPLARAFWSSGMPVSTTLNGAPAWPAPAIRPAQPASATIASASVTTPARAIVLSVLRGGRGDHRLRAAAGRGMGEGFLDPGERKARAHEALDTELRHQRQRAPERRPAAEGAVDPDLAEVNVEEIEGQPAVLGVDAHQLQHAGRLHQR